MSHGLRSGLTAEEVLASKRDRRPIHTDMSFKRVSECQKQIRTDEAHQHDHCARCLLSLEPNKSQFGHGYLDRRNMPVVSAHRTVIVVSLENYNPRGSLVRADTCVFGLGELDSLGDNKSIATMIEEMTLPKSLLYYTLKLNPEHIQSNWGEIEIKHNLPLPYRSISEKERSRITDWVSELRGHPQVSKMNHRNLHSEWDHNQLLLFLLGIGNSEYEASLMLQHRHWRNSGVTTDSARIIATENGKNLAPYSASPQLRRILKIAGDELVMPFGSWDDGKKFLWREYP